MLGKKSENAYKGPSAPMYRNTVDPNQPVTRASHYTRDSLPTQVFQSSRLAQM